MGKKWEGTEIENVWSDGIEKEAYELMLEEVAEIIYSHICQLPKISTSDSLFDENYLLQRTGTDA